MLSLNNIAEMWNWSCLNHVIEHQKWNYKYGLSDEDNDKPRVTRFANLIIMGRIVSIIELFIV